MWVGLEMEHIPRDGPRDGPREDPREYKVIRNVGRGKYLQWVCVGNMSYRLQYLQYAN